MSSTCFEPEGLSSRRQLYTQLWYGNSSSKHVEDIQIKILIEKTYISLYYVM